MTISHPGLISRPSTVRNPLVKAEPPADPVRRAGIDGYQSEASVSLLLSNKRQAAIAGGARNVRSIRAVCGCLRGSKPPRRDRRTHWEGRLRGLRGRRSLLPGTVSDPARGRRRDHQGAPLGSIVGFRAHSLPGGGGRTYNFATSTKDGSASFHPSSFEMRCTVPVPSPSDLATFKIPTPFASCFRTFRSVALSIFGRPSFAPCATGALETCFDTLSDHRPLKL